MNSAARTSIRLASATSDASGGSFGHQHFGADHAVERRKRVAGTDLGCACLLAKQAVERIPFSIRKRSAGPQRWNIHRREPGLVHAHPSQRERRPHGVEIFFQLDRKPLQPARLHLLGQAPVMVQRRPPPGHLVREAAQVIDKGRLRTVTDR